MLSINPKKTRFQSGTPTLAAIIALALVVRLFRLGRYALWSDEVDSIYTGLKHVMYHPLLFNELAAVWSRMTTNDFQVRLLPAILGVVVIVWTWRLGRLLFDRQTATIAALLMALSPPAVYYSRELRMYIFFLLLALASWEFLIRTMRDGGTKNIITLSLLITAVFYTHNFAVFLVAGQVIAALFFFKPLHNTIKKLITVITITSVLYSPWLIHMIFIMNRFVKSHYWAPPITWETLPYFLRFLTSHFEPHLYHTWLLGTIMMCFFIAGLFYPNQRNAALLVTGGIVVPALLIFITEHALPTTLFVARYVIFMLGPFLLITAAGITQIKKPLPRITALLVICGLQAGAITLQYRNVMLGPPVPETRPRKDFRTAALYIAKHYQPGDCIGTTCISGAFPCWYYLNYRLSLPEPYTLDIDCKYQHIMNDKYNVTKDIKKYYPWIYPVNVSEALNGCKRLWFYGTQWNENKDPNDVYYTQRIKIRDWLGARYPLLYSRQYFGVDLRLYDLTRPLKNNPDIPHAEDDTHISAQ